MVFRKGGLILNCNAINLFNDVYKLCYSVKRTITCFIQAIIIIKFLITINANSNIRYICSNNFQQSLI